MFDLRQTLLFASTFLFLLTPHRWLYITKCYFVVLVIFFKFFEYFYKENKTYQDKICENIITFFHFNFPPLGLGLLFVDLLLWIMTKL